MLRLEAAALHEGTVLVELGQSRERIDTSSIKKGLATFSSVQQQKQLDGTEGRAAMGSGDGRQWQGVARAAGDKRGCSQSWLLSCNFNFMPTPAATQRCGFGQLHALLRPFLARAVQQAAQPQYAHSALTARGCGWARATRGQPRRPPARSTAATRSHAARWGGGAAA